MIVTLANLQLIQRNLHRGDEDARRLAKLYLEKLYDTDPTGLRHAQLELDYWELRQKGKLTAAAAQDRIANSFGVSPRTVRRIVNGK
jgi:DNA polymerase III epsilon subunit-like protein